jgi:hypothetical protein
MAVLKSGTTIAGHGAIHAGNMADHGIITTSSIGSYALTGVPSNVITTSGGQTIAGITYFSNGESLNLYGIRGRFTNEYIHLYHKVGIGHPGGWGQGEGNTPGYGLSTYGGATIAYGNSAGMSVYGSITTDTHVYTNYSVRVGEIWGQGGLYRSSGHMMFGTEGGNWYFQSQNNTRAYFASGDGNLWMQWGGWLSDLLSAKQNASTAITTSNIGSQSVSYASSAGDADTLDGYHSNTVGNRHHTARGFYVDGDQNTYYPVLINGSGNYAFNRYSIYRYYGWTAPWDPIGTGAHRGGLTFDVEWSGDIAWGGNDKTLRVVQFAESYTNMVAGMTLPVTGGLCVWLRGGHAYYEIQVDAYPNTPTVYLDGFTAANGAFYGPREDTSNVQSEIYNRMPVRSSSELYDGGSRVITAGNIGSQSVSYATNSGNSATTSQRSFDYIYGTSYLESAGAVYGTIFYDNNDRNFYVDPHSSSRVRNLYVGDSGSNWVDTGSWGTQLHVSNGPHSIIRVYARSEGIETVMFSHVGGQSKVGSGTNHDFSIVRNFSDRMTFYSGYTYANGYLQAADSLRAPIFYDSNDTNYYVDPNSNSYLSTLRVADASGGVSLSVGNGSTHGVYTLDNARKYLVVAADYYPHMALVASGSNNANHGAVFSFVGTEGSSSRQWNIGIPNQNPFIFSIGYNRTGDNNPHYGVGDGWSSEDYNHARLSIDRDGNTKIRGMLYVNGTSGGISVGNAVIHSGNIGSQSVSYATTSGTSSATTQTNFAELFIENVAVATKEFVTSQGYLTSLPSHNHDDRYYTESESDSRFVNATGDTMTGTLAMHEGSYYGTITFGSTAYWRAGISQRDAANAELRIWAKGGDRGSIYFATNFDGESGAVDVPSDGMALKNNNLGIGGFTNTEFPSYKLHVKGTAYATSDFRAPIFYDSEDTGYYLDPNSQSYLNKLTLAGSTHFYPNNWIEFPNHYGLYSGTNNAHFYPNNASYGSWRVAGSRNGWHGIHFDSGSTLMMNSAETGVHREGVGWQWRWYNGEMYISAGSTGGGTERTVIHSGNIASQSVNYATSAGAVAWGNVSGRPTALSSFTNDLGNYGGWLTTGGKAADSELIDGIDSSRIIYGDGGFGSTSWSDMNNTAQKSGFFFYNNPTGNPFGDWTHWINSMGNSWNPNYGFQLAHAFHSDRFAVRVVANGGFGSWRTIIDSGNIGSQSVASATSASYADSIYWSGNQRLYGGSDGTRNTGWAYHNNNNSGLHWPNNGWHIYPVNASDMYIRSGASDCSLKFTKSGTSGSYVHCSAANEIGFLTTGRSWSLRVDNSGNTTATGDVTAFSDVRLKENIKPISGALDKVLSLQGVYYNRIDIEDKSTKIGFIAQDVKHIVPEVVQITSDELSGVKDRHSVDYGKLVALLTEAIKEQQKQIDELKSIINGFTV